MSSHVLDPSLPADNAPIVLGINAETQRFAEERRERRRKMLFSSALLCALCVSALKLV
jgi:hypothetical protein